MSVAEDRTALYFSSVPGHKAIFFKNIKSQANMCVDNYTPKAFLTELRKETFFTDRKQEKENNDKEGVSVKGSGFIF